MSQITDTVAELEALVDKHGMAHVLVALELMCGEKADWVESPESIGQPDKTLGKAWRKVGKACYRAAEAASDLP
jgi:hypothetical protein